MRKSHVLSLLCCALVLPSAHASELIISEFMASNSRTLVDEDNAYSDWVEIHNTTSTNVNIGGWYLTDSATSLTKWQFPLKVIPPRGFLVVFASGKNRRNPAANLHTSFSLSADGEYLALVRPNGTTRASEFSPAFPEQFSDIPYGVLMSGTSTTLLDSGAAVRATVPTSAEAALPWQTLAFDDAAWQSGVSGVGYDQSTNYPPSIGLDIGNSMSNVNASAFIRVPFSVTNPAAYNALSLQMQYDDGFVAYLNGTEVLRRNAPTNIAWDSTATSSHGAGGAAFLAETFEGAGTNYTAVANGTAPAPAIQTAGAGSTGRYLRLLYDGVGSALNQVAFRQAAPGLFEKIVTEFDFRMIDAQGDPADGFNFMLIPTATYGTNGAGLSGGAPAEEPNYPGVFAIGFDVYPHATANDISAHWNGNERLNVNIPRATLDLVSGAFHRVKVTLEHVTGGARVTVTLTPNINGTPGATLTPIDNLFIPDLNPYQSRIQFAGRTGGSHVTVDLDNIQAEFQPPSGTVAFEQFDISQAVTNLVTGTNILAIHGLNLSTNDSDFLIVPKLVASQFMVSTQAAYISPATPGTWNSISGAGTLDSVTFAPASGVFTNDVTITMAAGSSSAQIRYTLDGSTPNANSLLYTGAITRAQNTAIRARAFEAGKIESPVTSANYLIVDNTLTNFSSNLPLVLVDTLGAAVVQENKVTGYALFIDTNASGARVTLNGPFDFKGRIGFEFRGQSSAGFPKRSYNVELQDESGDDLKKELLGLPEAADWALYAPYTDKTLMNDFLTYELHEAMGNYAVRRKYVEVFVRSSAGKLSYSDYMGVFVLLEKIEIGANRVDIEKPQSGEAGDPITGGYIWKRDKGGNINDVSFTTTRQTAAEPPTSTAEALRWHDPKYSDLTGVQRAWLTNHLNEFEAVLYGNNWRHPSLGYAKYIDVRSYVDFHWIVEFPKNIDGIRLSNYLQKDRGGKIKELPIWDWNLSWGNANYLEGANTNGWYYPQLAEAQDMYLRRLRTDPDFTQKIIDRWGELRTNVFALSNLLARVDSITNLLFEAQARDFARWPRLGTYVWPNPDGPNATSADSSTLTWPINFVSPTTYQGIIGEMKKWIIGRHAWVDNQYLKAPLVSLPSGSITPGAIVSIGVPVGTLYYTLDGTDPRGSNGVISAAARQYTGPITLTNNSGLFVRGLSGTTWTPPAKAVYVVSTPELRITEIMYHPTDPATSFPYSGSDFEFVEIQNTGSENINLRGAQLSGGIEFTFTNYILAPGAHAVVVRNVAAFESRHGTGLPIAGVFEGQLNNAGDRLALLGPVGEPIHDINYEDGWHPVTDGLGFSLVIRDSAGPLSAWNAAAGWRASGFQGGSPGVADPAREFPSVVVNEVLSHVTPPNVRSIELYNTASTNVDIGGWYLTDSFSTPKKYRIPNGTVIAGNGYLVFTEAQFNAVPGATNSFNLDPDGDDTYLFSADLVGNLTGYAEGVDFGASEENVSFGRHVSSDGDSDFVPQIAITLDATNAGPRIGPVVISEVMYRPIDFPWGDNDADEYIELLNSSASQVALFSSAVADKTWHLREAVDFDFPANVTLAPGETVLVVSFSPTNSSRTDEFRARFGIAPGVRIFGPWAGKLDNSGERIELRRPAPPRTNGVHYVLAEKVTYQDELPWNPVADGYGASLHRVLPSAYGNDPAHWTAAVPNPGAAFTGGTGVAITTQPEQVNVLAGADTNLSVEATGPELRYQWRLNGLNLAGETNATLLLPNVQPSQSGAYVVAVFNAAGGQLSTEAQVLATPPVIITTHPSSQNVQPGATFSLLVAGQGNGPVSYQWRFNGTNIPGATNNALTYTDADLFAHAGYYDAVLSDSLSTNTTVRAAIVVLVKPVITNAPVATRVLAGGITRFAVVAGPVHPMLPLTNTWAVFGSIGMVTNTSNSVLYILNSTNNGFVRLRVANLAGQTNITSGLNVTVLADADRDGMADAWETSYGFATNSTADAIEDLDGDGMINRDEYVAGTLPDNADSVLRLMMVETNSAHFQFMAQSNISYTIQYRTNLLEGSWLSWSNVAAQTTGPRPVPFPAVTNDLRFYRIMTPQDGE